ncbi:helix-turn-helix domain-containing protein [Streptomyces olivoreticuli]|uniref:helix-turn-helix domain-containing protein n=1 Tax=Streptomyces olivoreticuli TaxID=68246 RepID=UPI0013C34B2D
MLVEQRYRAVLELRGGSPVSEVAISCGVSRQAVCTWTSKYEPRVSRAAGESPGFRERA